jgi:hypothetical protein
MANTNPTLSSPLADQTTETKTSFSFDVSSSFTDVDGDSLVYSARTTLTGESLPSWLNFNQQAGIFSGTPVKEDVAVINITVLADDQNSGLISDSFSLTVSHTNEAPVVSLPFGDDRSDPTTNSYSFEVVNAFADPDGDTLTYSAYIESKAIGSISTITLSGELNAADTATITLIPDLTITIEGSTGTYDSAEKLATAFATQTADGYTVTAEGNNVIVTSTEKGDSVTAINPTIATVTTVDKSPATGTPVTAISIDQPGKSLPDWLTINATTGILAGTPTVDNKGSYNIQVTATDPAGESISGSYNLHLWVSPDNVAPTVQMPLVDQTVNSAISQPFTFDTASAFTDLDGDTLSYSITINSHSYTEWGDMLDLFDGLPNWLTFNSSTGLLSGTPVVNSGQITFQITATDPDGEKVTEDFVLANKNIRDFLVNTKVDGNQSQAVVSTVTSGGYKITWLDGVQANDYIYRGQIFSEQGIKVGDEFLVDEGTANLSSKSSLVSLTEERQVEVYQSSGIDGYDIFARLLSASGEQIGAAFQVNQDSSTNQYAPTVAPLTDGNFVVSWHGVNTDNSLDVFAQRFNVNGEIIGFNSITGSEEAEQLKGTVFDDYLIALGGDDSIVDTTGNDYVDGGDGIDICIFSEAKSLYELTVDDSAQWQIKQGDVIDTLENVERLQFSDHKVALDLSGNAGFVAKLIGVLFGSDVVKNKDYVGAGLSYLETGGHSQDELITVALSITGMGEADYETSKAFYSNLVANLWVNAVGTTLTAELGDPIVAFLDDATLTVQGVVNIAMDTDYNKTQINFADMLTTGLDYL